MGMIMDKSVGILNEFSNILNTSILHELNPWLKNKLIQSGGNDWWTKKVREILTADLQRRFDNGEYKSFDDFDLYALLIIFKRNYGFLKSCYHLPDQRNIVEDMIGVRNDCVAHRPVTGLTPNEILACIDTAMHFTSLINASGPTKDQLRILSSKVKELIRDINATPQVIRGNRKELHNCFEQEQLTSSQKDAVDDIADFLADPQARCFILKGYAGTGKTYLIGGLVDYLRRLNIVPVLLAPTGRAAKVIGDVHKEQATTIHRHIYHLDKVQEYREIEEDGAITYKFYFELRNNDFEHDTVFIVDEASMVSDVYSEAEFMHYGSGRLLHDLLEYINFDPNDNPKKIIFIGDPAQLPPVGMNSSPALDREYLLKRCRIESRETVLTEIVRQSGESLVLKNANNIRKLLESNSYPNFDFQSDDDSICEVTSSEMIPRYLENKDDLLSGSGSAISIFHTNAQVASANKEIRSILFPGAGIIVKNDLLMVQRNNYNHEVLLFNGQVMKVHEVDDKMEQRAVTVNVGLGADRTRRNETVRLRFLTVVLRFVEYSGAPSSINCKLLINSLEGNDDEGNSLLDKALYVDFANRHSNMPRNSKQFTDELLSDPYFNALRIKYAYAVTCHKAQGGEWDEVYIDFSGMNKLNRDALRWSYTAITRSRERLIVANALHRKALPDSVITPPKPGNMEVKSISSEGLFFPSPSSNLPDFMRGCGHWLINLYYLISNILPEHFTLISYRPTSYKINWNYQGKECEGIIEVYYDNEMTITKITHSGILRENLPSMFSSITGKRMCYPHDTAILSPEEFSKQLPDQYRPAVHEMAVQLQKEHFYYTECKLLNEWQVRLTAGKGMDWALIDLTFDKRRTCKEVRISKSSCADFAEHIKKVILCQQ
jgi:hypothetical protein